MPALLRFAAVGTALLVFLFATGPGAAAADHAVILMYHHVGTETPPSTSVTADQFRDHITHLAGGGYTVWPVARIVSHLREGRELPDGCVGITFDDAYRSVYEKAYPLLKEKGMPFTVFVTTGGVDAGYKSYMTWEEMREMKANGAAIESHSRSHGFLVRRNEGESNEDWLSRVREDIDYSRRRIREEIWGGSLLFAWPYGEYTGALQQLLSGMGLTGFGQHSGPVWKGSDFEALPRFPMAGSYADPAEFRLKVRSLPLPVVSADPADPLLHPGAQRPFLRLKIEGGDFERESLACYAGAERAELNWSEEEGSVTVRASSPIPRGRSRYNCTARETSGDRWYWYSHLWILP
jgi:biofilm PGA synthesis lipoprotein PgaB